MNNLVSDDELDRRLTRARKQRELLLLERELRLTADDGAAEPAVAAPMVRMSDIGLIELMVSQFSADDTYDKWFDDLEDAFISLRFDDQYKMVAGRRLLTGTAKLFLRTITVQTYDDGLKSAML